MLSMMEFRRSYSTQMTVNGRVITEIVIDPHYEARHPDITDELILILVKGLDGREFKPEERDGDWEYFMLDQIEHENRLYRLVWCLNDNTFYLGVINCFRR